jgi:hypothetical protein
MLRYEDTSTDWMHKTNRNSVQEIGKWKYGYTSFHNIYNHYLPITQLFNAIWCEQFKLKRNDSLHNLEWYQLFFL